LSSVGYSYSITLVLHKTAEPNMLCGNKKYATKEGDMTIWITIISSLLSGLIVFFISTYFYMRHERRKEKLAVLRQLMGNRHGLITNGRL